MFYYTILDPRMSQTGRNLRRQASPASSQIRVSREIRPGCSGLVRSDLETSKDGDCTFSLGNLLTLLMVKNVSPYIQYEPLLFQLTYFVSHPPTRHVCEEHFYAKNSQIAYIFLFFRFLLIAKDKLVLYCH